MPARQTPRSKDLHLPDWLWGVAGIAVVALSLPLAVNIFASGELMHACPGHTPRHLPLDQRNWQMFGGTAAYLAACGWASIACAGVLLAVRPIRLWARWPALIGVVLVGAGLWHACHP